MAREIVARVVARVHGLVRKRRSILV